MQRRGYDADHFVSLLLFSSAQAACLNWELLLCYPESEPSRVTGELSSSPGHRRPLSRSFCRPPFAIAPTSQVCPPTERHRQTLIQAFVCKNYLHRLLGLSLLASADCYDNEYLASNADDMSPVAAQAAPRVPIPSTHTAGAREHMFPNS